MRKSGKTVNVFAFEGINMWKSKFFITMFLAAGLLLPIATQSLYGEENIFCLLNGFSRSLDEAENEEEEFRENHSLAIYVLHIILQGIIANPDVYSNPRAQEILERVEELERRIADFWKTL